MTEKITDSDKIKAELLNIFHKYGIAAIIVTIVDHEGLIRAFSECNEPVFSKLTQNQQNAAGILSQIVASTTLQIMNDPEIKYFKQRKA